MSAGLAELNAEDLKAEVRPGDGVTQPFWNVCSKQFLYAPSFDFKALPGAVKYGFRITDAKGRVHDFEADRPTASLAPVWMSVAPGPAKIVVTANGTNVVGRREFHRAAPFAPGSYPPAARPYGECASRALEWMFGCAWVRHWAEGSIDKTYQLNCFPSKMVPAVIDSMLMYAERHPERRGEALKIAENAARWLMENSVREPESMKGLPITYFDYFEETKSLGDPWDSKQISHRKRDQVMMIYPASVARAYLRLARATGRCAYFDYAKNIAERYLVLQRTDGSWPFVLQFPSGKVLSANAAGETDICEFLDEMSAETGDVRYRAASDRAIPSMERRIRTFDWEGQFEDVKPQAKPYANLSKHIAADTMIYLLGRDSKKYRTTAREALRFAEDQFVAWSSPAQGSWYVPGVIEQFECAVTIDASYAKMIRFYLKLYEAEGNPLDLAKARALGDAVTRNQMPDGLIPTVFPYDAGRAGRHWLNCMCATIRGLRELESYRGQCLQ